MAKIITLCGSTKYKSEFEKTAKQLIEMGWFVHSVEIFAHTDKISITADHKLWLKQLHFWKIRRSDAIFVIDVDGYVGESTQTEIEYAKELALDIFHFSKDNIPNAH